MYQDTVTVFNRVTGERGRDKWLPTVIRGVQVTPGTAAVTRLGGVESGDRAVVNVRYGRGDDGEIYVGGKLWLPPKAWRAQASGSLASSVTFGGGEAFDFFMLGEWDGADDACAPVSDTDYAAESGGFYGHMNRTRDYVFAVTSVSGPFRLIPHFEITGR